MIYNLNPSNHSYSAQPGDTLNFTAGNYTYFTADGLSGTKENPITLAFQPGVVFANGFDLSNVSNLIFDGGTSQSLYIKNATGVPLSFKGKCSNIEIKGFKIEGAYSWIWFKTEVGEPAFTNWNYWTKNADGTISPNFVMDGLKLSNFTLTNANFDGGYIGSTGQKADRAVTIDGKTYFPYPAKVANIQIENGTMDGSARTGLQISGLDYGTNYLKNVSIKNSGKSKEQYQGANFLLGGNSPAGIEIDNCTFDGSNLYSVRTDGGGLIKFTNNKVSNSTIVNGQANSQAMAAVQFDAYENAPSTFIIEGNTIGASNNNVSVVVYGNTKSVSPDSTFINNSIAGSFQNFSGVEFKTTTVPPPPPPPPVDPYIVSIVPDLETNSAVINYSDGSQLIQDNLNRIVINFKTNKYFSYDITNAKLQIPSNEEAES